MLQALLMLSTGERLVVVLDSEYVYKGNVELCCDGAGMGGGHHQVKWASETSGKRYYGSRKGKGAWSKWVPSHLSVVMVPMSWHQEAASE